MPEGGRGGSVKEAEEQREGPWGQGGERERERATDVLSTLAIKSETI